ncbi:UDP-N-acetylmuramate--L-alanine ligase [Enterobacteriaceae endosymbiont of Donacia tomentosa]|uniref:UDP-N-acetylmuramate--L-alanine ligase n=1 Tax=Enterobacteriaceae endosymbiont of Donacia tomentosa TaxID=2675787 RepID=UPI001448DEDF|nr:UDP-N-acetylmuramate--L-alanine ligase [Enterobacteriaceae endosymbiont of Donacia tomentosa]QJC31590.1 UDP-N-acetylmuramate--L-alanine ligase [Enterobacteriaceae endosymbiont of Donacia tomentosa]
MIHKNINSNISLREILKINNINHIYFIGIGGSGMGGLATILVKLGYKVSGSDLVSNFITKKLILLNVKIYSKHDGNNLKNVDLVVVSTAIKNDNPELIIAKKLNIIIISRAQMLAELMRFNYGITITGTHGKTTTTAMIYEIFKSSGLDPTFVNGGIIKSSGLYADLGLSKYFIAEADESDKSFLKLNPIINIVTNIENEHLEYYDNNIEILKSTFLNFLKKIPFYGCIIICIDNKNNFDLFNKYKHILKCKIITYGFNNNADIKISNYRQKRYQSKFNLLKTKENTNLKIELTIPGLHNALNATASFALSSYIGLKDSNILKSLKNFGGVKRRLDILGTFILKKKFQGNVIVIDDYGHHPTEINMTIHTIKNNWPNKNLIMVFQPHKYTRTKNLLEEFVKTLSNVNLLFLLKVYSARENYIKNANSKTLYRKIKKLEKTHPILIRSNKYNDIASEIYLKLTGNDVLVFQGAGDINNISAFFIKNKLKQ